MRMTSALTIEPALRQVSLQDEPDKKAEDALKAFVKFLLLEYPSSWGKIVSLVETRRWKEIPLEEIRQPTDLKSALKAIDILEYGTRGRAVTRTSPTPVGRNVDPTAQMTAAPASMALRAVRTRHTATAEHAEIELDIESGTESEIGSETDSDTDLETDPEPEVELRDCASLEMTAGSGSASAEDATIVVEAPARARSPTQTVEIDPGDVRLSVPIRARAAAPVSMALRGVRARDGRPTVTAGRAEIELDTEAETTESETDSDTESEVESEVKAAGSGSASAKDATIVVEAPARARSPTQTAEGEPGDVRLSVPIRTRAASVAAEIVERNPVRNVGRDADPESDSEPPISRASTTHARDSMKRGRARGSVPRAMKKPCLQESGSSMAARYADPRQLCLLFSQALRSRRSPPRPSGVVPADMSCFRKKLWALNTLGSLDSLYKVQSTYLSASLSKQWMETAEEHARQNGLRRGNLLPDSKARELLGLLTKKDLKAFRKSISKWHIFEYVRRFFQEDIGEQSIVAIFAFSRQPSE